MKLGLCAIAFVLVFDFCWSINVSCHGRACEVDGLSFNPLPVRPAPVGGLGFNPLPVRPAPVGTCMVMGDPQYRTFDGGYYRFMGTCTYVIAKNCRVDDKHPAFQINIKNEYNGNTKNIQLSVVTVLVYGNTLTFNRLKNGLVWINGLIWNLPVSLNNGRVTLDANGLSVTMQTGFGLSVQYDWDQYLVVTVPRSFQGKMCGMCGNYNGDKNDDLGTPGGTVAGSIPELGKSWRVPGSPGDALCRDECVGRCPGCELASWFTRTHARLRCNLVTFNEGPWSKCKSVINTNVFYENCLYGYCVDKDVSSFLCQTAKMYSDACERAGVHVAWRDSLKCQNPTCPPNSHFEACACPATCVTLTPPACEAKCVEACTCNKGYLWSGNKCVFRSECGCLYKNEGEERYLQAGESIWVDENCSKKCTCLSKNREVVCEETSCPIGKVCAVVNGTRVCQEMPTASCSIYGDPHYNTFDNMAYDFQGTCNYTAAQSCHLEGTRLTSFAVTVQNERWHAVHASPNVAVAKAVAVAVYGMSIVLRRKWQHQVMVDGVLTNIPVNLHNGDLLVQKEGHLNVVTTKFGLRVAYNMVYDILITLPGTYSGKTCGLCGNFNGDKTDELQLPDGSKTKDIRTFGAAWKVAVSSGVCDDGCSTDSCPKCPEEKKLRLEKACSVLMNPKGPFTACHHAIDPKSYFRDCVYDACITEEDQLCHSVAAYMTACQSHGIVVKKWRTSTFCPLSCPANSVYKICMHPCDVPCPGLLDVMKCVWTCAEGCVCKSGFFNSGSACVAAKQCGCYENGHAYKVNEMVITKKCQERLTCLPSGKLHRESISCGSDEVCDIRNGVRGCYLRQCLLQAGGSFRLFNGETSTITSAGAYELVKVCRGALEAEWFRVVVVLGPDGSVLALYVFFDQVFVTVSGKLTTWINGNEVTLPQQLKNKVIVRLNDGTITIKNASLEVSFSLSLGLALSVNEKMMRKVCGACGSGTEVLTWHHGLRSYLALWRALDFPSVPC